LGKQKAPAAPLFCCHLGCKHYSSSLQGLLSHEVMVLHCCLPNYQQYQSYKEKKQQKH